MALNICKYMACKKKYTEDGIVIKQWNCLNDSNDISDYYIYKIHIGYAIKVNYLWF